MYMLAYTLFVYTYMCTSNKIGENNATLQKKLHVGVCSCLKRRTFSCLLACLTQRITEDRGCMNNGNMACVHGTYTVCGTGVSMVGGHGILHC